jgi:hypothetical protein
VSETKEWLLRHHRRSSRPPRGRRRRSTATTAITTASAAPAIAAIAAAATTTTNRHSRPPRSPASSSPGGKQAQPALLRPCALHPRPCELPVALLPASGVAGDAVATRCACSRGTLGTPATCRIVSCLCCSCMAGCGCADGLGCWKPGWRPASRKIKSGLLPQFQVARLAP